MTAAVGVLARLGIGASSPVTNPLAFLNESLALEETMIDTAGLVGSRSHPLGRVRQGTRKVHGSITLHPTMTEWAYLLQWILGGAPSAGVYPLAESLIPQYVTVDRVQKVFTYSGVYVSRATIRGAAGEPLQVTLDLLGIDEAVGSAGTFPNLVLDEASPPLMFFDLALTANGVSTNAREIELVIDNHLEDGRFLNSQTLVSIFPKDRTIECNLTVPFGDSSALYGLGPGGFAVLGTFTDGADSLAFSLPSVVAPRRSPTVPGHEEEFLHLPCAAKTSGTSPNSNGFNNELTVTVAT